MDGCAVGKKEIISIIPIGTDAFLSFNSRHFVPGYFRNVPTGHTLKSEQIMFLDSDSLDATLYEDPFHSPLRDSARFFVPTTGRLDALTSADQSLQPDL
jgi:hypothetical protein